MNAFDFEQWTEDEIKTGERILFEVATGIKKDNEGGDFSECPKWVADCGGTYLKSLTEEQPKEVAPKLFQATTPNDRKIRAKIGVAKLDAYERKEWLEGENSPKLLERFGPLSAVPDFAGRAAIKNLEQRIANLKGGQRVRGENTQVEETEIDDPLAKILAISADYDNNKKGT